MDALLSYAKYDTFLNLFSDSQIGIFSLRKWIFNWVDKSDTSVIKSFIKSDKEPVANQELLTAIIGLIRSTGAHTSLYHIRGHMNPNKVHDMQTFIKAFVAFVLFDDFGRFHFCTADHAPCIRVVTVCTSHGTALYKYDKTYTGTINRTKTL